MNMINNTHLIDLIQGSLENHCSCEKISYIDEIPSVEMEAENVCYTVSSHNSFFAVIRQVQPPIVCTPCCLCGTTSQISNHFRALNNF